MASRLDDIGYGADVPLFPERTAYDDLKERPGDPAFAPRTTKLTDIQGFQGEARTDNVFENVGLDAKEIIMSYGYLGSELAKHPIDTLAAIGKNLPGAIKESYTRWYEAAQNGMLLEAIQKHPLQAVQDLTLPISLLASGGSAGLSYFGKGAAAARALRNVAKVADVAGLVTDPAGTAVFIGGRKIAGKLLEKATGKNLKPPKPALQEAVESIERPDVREAITRETPFDEATLTQDFIDQGLSPEEAAARAQQAIPMENQSFWRADKSPEYNRLANEILKVDPAFLPNEKKIVGNIRIEKFDQPSEFKKVEQFIIENHLDDLKQARNIRGISDINSTAQKAEFIARETGKNPNDVLRQMGPQYVREISAEKLQISRALKLQAQNDMMLRAELVRSGFNSEVDLLKYQLSVDRYVNALNNLSGETAETGRALRILRERPKSEKFTDQALSDAISALGGRAQAEKLAKEMLKIQSDGQALAKVASKVGKATTWDKFMEVLINGWLSGIQTQVVNVMGSMSNNMFRQVEDLVASGISKLPVGSGELSGFEALARIEGMAKGYGKAASDGIQSLITETSPDLMGKTELPRRAIGGHAEPKGLQKIENAVGRIIRVPGTTLQGVDTFMKSIISSGELHALAEREARRAMRAGEITFPQMKGYKAKLLEQPTENMLEEALARARKDTFTKQFSENWIGELGKLGQNASNRIKPLKVIIPFVRTPTNILESVIERTPLAFTLKDVRGALLGPKSIARDQAWSRVIMGTGVGWMAAWGAANGFITGGAPSDRSERLTRQAGGFQEYSFKGKDGYVSYSRLDPLGMITGMGADMYRLADVMTQKERDSIPALIASSVFKNMSSKTYISGLSSLVQAINEPDRYAEYMFGNLAGSLIPFSSLIGSIERARDPVQRDATSIYERAQARGNLLFGYRDELPPKRNIWGEPLVYERRLKPIPEDDKDTIDKLVETTLAVVNPFYMRSDKKDKVTNFMIDHGFFPGMPGRRIQGVELTPTEYNRYVELSGRPAKELLNKRAASEEWDKAAGGTVEDRVDLIDFIDSVIDSYRRDARDQLIREFPELELRIRRKQEELPYGVQNGVQR